MPTSQDLLTAHLTELNRLQNVSQTVRGGITVNRQPILESQRATTIADLVRESQRIFLPSSPAPSPPPSPPPPPELDKLELDTGSIGFNDGVAAGGNSHLSLFPNGAYSFTGHFHDSGAVSYDTSLVWVLKGNSGTAFTFSHKGRIHGTFEAGSRDDDWGESNTNAALAAAWSEISSGYTWHWEAAVNADFGSLIDAAVKAVGAVGTVIAVV